MEDLNLILALIASNKRAEIALSSRHNFSRYIGPLGLSQDPDVFFEPRDEPCFPDVHTQVWLYVKDHAEKVICIPH